MLVPLNFAAARSVLSDENLMRETMWLAGSVTTAAFYTAVAWLGVGRRYSFGAGVAFVSAMMAAVVRLDVAPEWAPMCFLALAGRDGIRKHRRAGDAASARGFHLVDAGARHRWRRDRLSRC